MVRAESFAISVIRSFALILIILCHILQGLNDKSAWILNVGVQIFFVISGFLYGKRNIGNVRQWYLRRLSRIYIPYIIYFICVLVLYILFHPNFINIQALSYFFNLQAFVKPINGLQHLWFLSIIMFCYLITPFLEKIFASKFRVPYFTLLTVFLAGFSLRNMYSAWVLVYLLSYFFSRLYDKFPLLLYIVIAAMVILLFAIFRWEYLLDYSSIYNISFHVIIGFAVFLLLHYLILKLNVPRKSIFFSFMDKYSYEMYLVHHLYILGPFSLLYFSFYLYVNIALIIVLIVLSAIVLQRMSHFVIKKMNI